MTSCTRRSFKDDFREFVDTLTVALRQMDQSSSPIRHIHPVVLTDGSLTCLESACPTPPDATP